MSENEGTQGDDVGQSGQELPDWARQQITDANAEAARYRVEKKEAIEAFKQENIETLRAKESEWDAKVLEVNESLEAQKIENLKLTAAVQSLAPNKKINDFAELLKGDTEDELQAHAEKLTELFSVVDDQGTPPAKRATDKSQSTGNNHAPLNGDSILNAVMGAIK